MKQIVLYQLNPTQIAFVRENKKTFENMPGSSHIYIQKGK